MKVKQIIVLDMFHTILSIREVAFASFICKNAELAEVFITSAENSKPYCHAVYGYPHNTKILNHLVIKSSDLDETVRINRDQSLAFKLLY